MTEINFEPNTIPEALSAIDQLAEDDSASRDDAFALLDNVGSLLNRLFNVDIELRTVAYWAVPSDLYAALIADYPEEVASVGLTLPTERIRDELQFAHDEGDPSTYEQYLFPFVLNMPEECGEIIFYEADRED